VIVCSVKIWLVFPSMTEESQGVGGGEGGRGGLGSSNPYVS
jgi:hypothetical protein